MNQQFKRITRTISVPCPECGWSIHRDRQCNTCNGTGEVSRTINELVPVTHTEDSHEDNEVMLAWAGSVE